MLKLTMDTAHNNAVDGSGGEVRHPELSGPAEPSSATAEREAHPRCGFAYRLVDARIAERWAIRDDLTMLRQLGALHP